MPVMSTGPQYSKSKKEKNFTNIVVEGNKAECNYPTMEKKSLQL